MADLALTIRWLRGLADGGGKAVVGNIDARCLGRIADDLERLVKALEEEREYWAGKVASAMIRKLPSDDSQDRVDRISRVLTDLIPMGHT